MSKKLVENFAPKSKGYEPIVLQRAKEGYTNLNEPILSKSPKLHIFSAVT